MINIYNTDKQKELAEAVSHQYRTFYNIVVKEYGSTEWVNLTEAEKSMMLWFDTHAITDQELN